MQPIVSRPNQRKVASEYAPLATCVQFRSRGTRVGRRSARGRVSGCASVRQVIRLGALGGSVQSLYLRREVRGSIGDERHSVSRRSRSTGGAKVKATVGDSLVVKGHRAGQPDKGARIVEVQGDNGAPPYLVEWSSDDHAALVFPGSDAMIKHPSARARPKSQH